jgi:uncharacterized protein involved in exopolysaccharide biosynthesis
MVRAMTRTTTPRDRLDRLVDYGRKARRYWYIVAGAIALGGVLSVLFAVTRPPKYKSWSLLFYQERVQSSLLQGREVAQQQRNIGERYREILLSRDLLAQVVSDPALNPFPDELAKDGVDAAVEELRTLVALESRGANAIRIVYTDSKPGRAQAVTARLTELLKAKEDAIRDDQVRATVEFAETQQKLASDELRTRQRALSQFLANHPEFAQEDTGGTGAGIRARARDLQPATGNSRIATLERQRARLKARLDAPPGAPVPVVRTPRAPSAARIAAEAAVNEAQRDVREAERALEAASQKYTDQHPDVRKAKEQVATAKERLARAKAAVPDEPEDDPIVVAPTTEADRQKLQRELAQIDDQLAAERKRDKNAAPSQNDATTALVELETDFAKLRDAVDEQRDRVETLADTVFRAQIDAQQQLQQQGARLALIDPAMKPVKPTGSGKTIVVLAGLVVFGAIGLALAFGLAILDDRLYRRQEIEELGLVSVLAVIPPTARARRKRSTKA